MKNDPDAVKPLLSMPPYGVHVLKHQAVEGYGFYGCIPMPLKGKRFESLEEGINAFVEWFKSLETSNPQGFQEWKPLLREDLRNLI